MLFDMSADYQLKSELSNGQYIHKHSTVNILTDTQLTDALSTYDPNFLLQCTVAYQPVENLQDIICKLRLEKAVSRLLT